MCTSLLGDGTREHTDTAGISCADQWVQRDTWKWWHHAELHSFQRQGEPAQGSSRTGWAPPNTAGCVIRLGMVGLWIAGQEGKAINISLLCFGGSQMKHSSHKGETLSTLTQEDVKQHLHKANVKLSGYPASQK